MDNSPLPENTSQGSQPSHPDTPLQNPIDPNPNEHTDEDVPHQLSRWRRKLKRVPRFIKWGTTILLLLLLSWWLLEKPTAAPDKTYFIAIDPSWYPLQLAGREKQMTAFCEMLITSIAQESKLKMRLIRNSPQRLIPDLEAGHYNGILSSQPASYFPAGQFLFSKSIYRLGPVLVVREDSNVTSLEGLADRFVGYVGDSLVISQINDYPTIYFTSYITPSAALSDLEIGKIEAVIIDALQANTLLHGFYAGKFKVASAPLTNAALRLVLHKDPQSEDFIAHFDKGLKKLKRDGTYKALIEQWDLVNTDPD